MSIEMFEPEKAVCVRSVPPFDTGKVKIGLMYIPRQVNHPDADMCRLQTALLATAPGPRSLPNVGPFEAAVERLRNLVRALS